MGSFDNPYELVLRRYRTVGGVPLVLMNGVMLSGRVWDLAEGNPQLSLAAYLWQAGYDVWIANYRDLGFGPGQRSTCPAMTEEEVLQHYSHLDYRCETTSIDDYAIRDVDGVIGYVFAHTGRKVVWVGHSLGGLVLLPWLEGANFDAAALAEGHKEVVLDPSLAAERQSKVRAWLSLMSVPFLAHRHTLEEERRGWYASYKGTKLLRKARWFGHLRRRMVADETKNPDYYDYNFLLEAFIGADPLFGVLEVSEHLPLAALLNPRFTALIERFRLADAYLAYSPTLPAWASSALLSAIENYPSKVFQHLREMAQHGLAYGFSPYGQEEPSYWHNFRTIRNAAVMFVYAGKDKLFDESLDDQLQQYTHPSTRRLVAFEAGLGHNDLFVRPDYYPKVEGWLEQLRGVTLSD